METETKSLHSSLVYMITDLPLKKQDLVDTQMAVVALYETYLQTEVYTAIYVNI